MRDPREARHELRGTPMAPPPVRVKGVEALLENAAHNILSQHIRHYGVQDKPGYRYQGDDDDSEIF